MVGHPEASILEEKSQNQVCSTHLVKQISNHSISEGTKFQPFYQLHMLYPDGKKNVYMS